VSRENRHLVQVSGYVTLMKGYEESNF